MFRVLRNGLFFIEKDLVQSHHSKCYECCECYERWFYGENISHSNASFMTVVSVSMVSV